jgi:hypothetical protein
MSETLRCRVGDRLSIFSQVAARCRGWSYRAWGNPGRVFLEILF